MVVNPLHSSELCDRLYWRGTLPSTYNVINYCKNKRKLDTTNFHTFYNQSVRPIHILKNPDHPGFESMEFEEEPFIMSFFNPESIDAVISILQRAKCINFTSKSEQQKTE